MNLRPEHVSTLLTDKNHAGFLLASLKETSWFAKWNVGKVSFWKDSLIHKPILN